MSLLVDSEIRELAEAGMISPYIPHSVRSADGHPLLSYGQSSVGYDIRAANVFKIFTNAHCAVVDPKNIDERAFVEVRGPYVLIPPNSFMLTHSVETFDLPRDICMVAIGKSTYARCGLVVACTPGEPGWRGTLTVEISNTTPLPAKVYAGEGICQCLFFRTSRPCTVSYADVGPNGQKRKYQDQPAEIVLPRV